MIGQFNMPNIRILLDMGYEVHVACNFKEGNTCSRQQVYRIHRMLRQMHVMCHQWDCPRNILPVTKCFTAYGQLMKLTGRYHFSWLHCHSPIGSALARAAAHRRGIRVIYTAHGFHFYQGAPLFHWMLYYPAEKLLARWTDVLLTVNQEDYRLAVQKMKARKTAYIPGVGIDVSSLQKQTFTERAVFRKKYQIPENAVILLSVGELSRRKNHQMVISALSGMSEKEVHYLICGKGRLKKALLQKARSCGVSKQVHILGFQENVADFYYNADIFVFPSRQEGLPAALMEAMACGLPCIVSDIRGNRELITEGRKDCGGICFPLRRPGKLRYALELLLENPKLRYEYGRYNKKKVQEYSLQVVSRRMKKIYSMMG